MSDLTEAQGQIIAGDYFLCGWRVRSAIPLSEAMPWAGDDRPPDVTIALGLIGPH